MLGAAPLFAGLGDYLIGCGLVAVGFLLLVGLLLIIDEALRGK